MVHLLSQPFSEMVINRPVSQVTGQLVEILNVFCYWPLTQLNDPDGVSARRVARESSKRSRKAHIKALRLINSGGVLVM